MKLNICVSVKDIVIDTYTNLTYGLAQDKSCIQGNFNNLDCVCDDNECLLAVDGLGVVT